MCWPMTLMLMRTHWLSPASSHQPMAPLGSIQTARLLMSLPPTITAVNDAPAANDDNTTTLEDTAVTIDVLANDSDVEGDSLVVSAVTQGGNCTVIINADNIVTYTPDPDFNLNDSFDGTDVFTYTVSDGNGGSDVALVTIVVTPVNDP